MQNVEQIAVLIKRALSNAENRIVGADAMLLLGVVQKADAQQMSVIERKNVLAADATREKLSQIDVSVRGLQFHECYASFEGAKTIDLSDVDTTLTVYYGIDYSDSEYPEFYVRHIVTTSPLVFVGTYCEHIIGAAVDLMPDMCEHRKRAISDDAEDLMVANEREAA